MPSTVATPMCDFTLKMVNELMKPGENMFLSPASIQLALGMVLAGADGNTAAELRNTVFSTLDEETVHKELAALQKRLNPWWKPYQLCTANRLYCNGTFKCLKPFLDTVSKQYASTFRQVDFENDSAAVCKEINKYVEGVTKGRIRDLISENGLNSDARLVIVNAIYFKGKWKRQFMRRLTTKKDFHIDSNTTIQVEMMRQCDSFQYYEDVSCKALIMPFKGGDLSMLFVLPMERFGLHNLIKNMDGGYIMQIPTKACTTEVLVTLPKIRFKQQFELKEVLQKLGVLEVFVNPSQNFTSEPPANLERIAPKCDLFVSSIIHKTFLEADEEGSEAVAATVVQGKVPLCAKKPRPRASVFHADQPFFLALLTDTCEPVFAGCFSGGK